jgi:hypothetical protein
MGWLSVMVRAAQGLGARVQAGLNLASAIFAVIAAYFLYSGFSLETTVASAGTPVGFDGVANLQLMHIQSLNFATGIGAAVVSAVLLIGAAIVGAIEGRE